MLIQYNISSTCGVKEASVKITVCQKHSQSSCKYRKTSNKLNANKALCPNKQRQTVLSHTLCSHVCNSNQKIDRTQNTSNTSNVQTKNSQIHRCTRVALCTGQGRVRRPPYTRSLFHLCTLQQLDHRHGEYPKTDIIHTRKSHHYCYLKDVYSLILTITSKVRLCHLTPPSEE